jgi:hypothetical protein
MPRAYNYVLRAKTCRGCSAEFEGHSNRKYCSAKCRDNSQLYQETRQKLRNSNLAYFLREKVALATARGKYEVAVTHEELALIWDKQSGLCAISGVPMTYTKGAGRVPTNLSIDRIDSSLGYTLDNIQLVCYQANLMKSELSIEQLKFWCERILNAA